VITEQSGLVSRHADAPFGNAATQSRLRAMSIMPEGFFRQSMVSLSGLSFSHNGAMLRS
jgi:hypothetical protein